MCGIVGIISQDREDQTDMNLLRLMNAALTHRGPDDEGYWTGRGVGLAMRRLSIIDLKGGHQPLCNEDSTIWTVFNGEIYNFIQLREGLIQKGHQFKTHSDTEVIVHLYEERGEDFVKELRGMFAIALWDDRSEKLLLYRDRVGIKPLHYWFRNGTLLFSSEIKALLEHPEVSRKISFSAINDYLSYLYIPSPGTVYREIFKLPAGHCLTYFRGKIDIRSYWDFHFETDTGIREEEWIEKLQAALEESIKLHLVSDVPLGAFLSGGMDSSTVVAGMSRLMSSPVKTYSIGFEDDQFNELPFARQVAMRFKTDHHEKIVKADSFDLLHKIISAFDEPFGDPSSIPAFLVSEFARHDLKVVLSGDGGDELFSGYLWTRKEAFLEQYRRLPQAVKKTFGALFLPKNYHPLMETGRSHLIRRFLYDGERSPVDSFSRRIRCFQPWMKDELFEDGVLQELKNENHPNRIQSLFGRNGSGTGMEKLLYWDSKVYLPDDLLTKVDRMSMVHSLEVRVPLLDHKLVELAASIPFSLKLKGRTTKYILKRAVEKTLPSGILKQRKQGFAIPVHRWFREELFNFSEKILLKEKSQSRRYFRPSYIRWMLDAHKSGKQRFGFQLYALVILELWLLKNDERIRFHERKTIKSV